MTAPSILTRTLDQGLSDSSVLEFQASNLLTVGVELELQLIDRRTGDLTRGASDLIALVSKKPFPGEIKPEITESMLEISTSVHRSFAPLMAELITMRDTLVAGADRLDIESPAVARIRSSAGMTGRSTIDRASGTSLVCTVIWQSSSPSSASTCISAAKTGRKRCGCCIDCRRTSRSSSRWQRRVRTFRAWTRRSTARA